MMSGTRESTSETSDVVAKDMVANDVVANDVVAGGGRSRLLDKLRSNARSEGDDRARQQNRARNNVKRLREDRLLSKAELARKAGVSALTIDRVENGRACRMDTKRKIILALGMRIEDKDQVFVPDPGLSEELGLPDHEGSVADREADQATGQERTGA